MDDDDDLGIGLDLNRNPFVDPSPSSPAPAQTGIVDRIRQLEAVTARANQRQRLRRFINNPEFNYTSVIDSAVAVRNENQGDNGVVEGPINGGGEERVSNCKRDVSHLAKALKMDLDGKKADNGGNFFDCNICLDMAKDPILTCCGHLFCWGCFYQVPYVDSISKECPACKGEVIDSNITPIYGNGKNSQVFELENGVKIPPRPHARRVEGVRQQGFGRDVSHIPVADALRRIRIGLGLIEENAHPPPGLNGLVSTSAANPVVMSDAASISSAINSAERLFIEDLETYISVANTTVNIQSEPQSAEMNLSVPISSRRNLATTVVHLGSLGNDGSLEIDLTIARRGSSRRRGVSSFEGQSSLELRRRQLR
ncbi:hypothetical protein L6452_30323 [Arctium lappa]|uniref:Uncharacterized protein n=1 Tax=Arctium lappa TaxID=4217 RepID=A0ACB8ZMI8_ARCLA|nr:hypothetical protein L6452_30323 [Arctium lappa]